MKVIIVGSGLAGPVAALALQRLNIASKIFELRSGTAFEGGNIALAPNALRVLDQLGVQKRYGYKALRISRGIVRQTLLEAVHERGIELRYNSRLVDVRETAQSTVIATFADGHIEEADFLIGADGIHSRVRTYLDPTSIPRFSGQMGVGGTLPLSKLPESYRDMYMPCLILGKLNSLLLMPCTNSGDRVGVAATVEAQDRTREGWAQLQNDKEGIYTELQSHHENDSWPEVVHVACRDIEPSSLSIWPFFQLPELDSWTSHSNKVIVIGDAAHAMPPTGGQGAAMAFEDAITLADTLALIDGKDEDPAESVKQWQTDRRERTKKILQFTSTGGNMRKSSVSTYKQIIKEWVMWAYFLWVGKEARTSWIYEYETKRAVP
ncbi:hypothetical protein A1O3_09849 [Capronia epimyces CBS 606.96]|uniref:FAD-binding domain-containing protein n=1 Tax=Capronia epimyces CBS 606.96 TaxID=1182542 RepID=W9XKW6_9EURO|nr:uncharacterized protein A1O3_09849 [Capronia epimyces CBS 606.96]EXJ77621.1 hypothetical protein A1O3_09849 [Capronia epimyces CBS 606.96]